MTRLVAALGVLGIVLGLVAVLGREGRLTLGTNRVSEPQFVRVLGPGRTFCQAGEVVPSGAGIVQFRIGTYGPPGPPLTVRFVRRGRVVTAGNLRAGWPQGDIGVPIRPLRQAVQADRMCVRNGGGGRLAFAGERDVVRTDYLAARAGSWLARFGVLRDRFDEGKSRWFGHWSLLAALVLVLAAAVLTTVTLVRRPT